MPVSEHDFRKLALKDPHGHWELFCGRVRKKPEMSVAHNHVAFRLMAQLLRQLDETRFEVRMNAGHVQRASESYFIPDVFVLPLAFVGALLQQNPHQLEAYPEPLPLVVEVWSPSTGGYDVATKLGEYQRRGDLEIWYLHPYDHTLTAWQRQPDGSYAEVHYDGGAVSPVALAGVTVDLDALFA
jgi:Uma2 family endonuclease